MLDPDGRRLSGDTILTGDETRRVELSEEERERRRQLSERLRAITDAGADYRPALETGGLLLSDGSGMISSGIFSAMISRLSAFTSIHLRPLAVLLLPSA